MNSESKFNISNFFDDPLKYEREIEGYNSKMDIEFIKQLRLRGFTAKRIVDVLHCLDIAIPI